MKTASLFVAALPAALALSCGNPDNQVVGTLSATANSPVVSFDHIRSVISGTATLKDAGGQSALASVVIISDQKNLCDALKAHPDYFHTSQAGNIALILFAPADRLGVFAQGRDPHTGAVVYATNGPPSTVVAIPANDGFYISLTNFDLGEGGQGNGTFEGLFQDVGGNGAVHDLYGRFKSTVCSGISTVQLP